MRQGESGRVIVESKGVTLKCKRGERRGWGLADSPAWLCNHAAGEFKVLALLWKNLEMR